MSNQPDPIFVAKDPGTKRTVTGATAKFSHAPHQNRRAWGIVADKTNTDTVFFTMAGGIAAGTAITPGASCDVGAATNASFALTAGQSFSEPVGANAIYTGAINVLANSGSQVIYSWEY